MVGDFVGMYRVELSGEEFFLKMLDRRWLLVYNLFIAFRGVAQLVARHIWDVDVACSSHVTPTTNRITKPFLPCNAVCFLRT